MSASDIVRSMRGRIPWTVAGQVLRSLDLDKSMGWRRTLARVEDGDVQYEDAESNLAEALEEHLLCGEKLVRLYRVDDGDTAVLRSQIDAIEVPENDFSYRYPVLLEDSELHAFGGDPPRIAAKVSHPDGTYLVLASTRYLQSREIVLPAELPDSAAHELRQYEQIICVGHRRLQACDVLWVPNEGNVIEIRTDFPLGMHSRVAVTAANQAQTRFGQILDPRFFAEQVNLFPAIQGLYSARGDGRMVELGFMVAGSSQKLEKSRRDVECCRVETYHLGGIGVLSTPIAPYIASVLWNIDLGSGAQSEPEVTLRGLSVQTAAPGAFLGDMTIRNCVGIVDYSHARDRVLAHLPA